MVLNFVRGIWTGLKAEYFAYRLYMRFCFLWSWYQTTAGLLKVLSVPLTPTWRQMCNKNLTAFVYLYLHWQGNVEIKLQGFSWCWRRITECIIWPTEILFLPKLSKIFLRQILVFTLHFERPIKARIAHCCVVNIKYFSISSRYINTEATCTVRYWLMMHFYFVFVQEITVK